MSNTTERLGSPHSDPETVEMTSCAECGKEIVNRDIYAFEQFCSFNCYQSYHYDPKES